MSQKVTFNGIEISQSKYDKKSVSIFDFLDKVKTRLERGLSKEDGNSQFSVNVDFSSSKSPSYKIHANGSTSKKTWEKISRIMKKTSTDDHGQSTGSVKVNFLVKDRK
ncbi:MAG TPA: hypothetical protein VLA72_10905 [Anaerolineales bacterium]|nr:hypothetical protein [Anaerolineales bacterium]